MRNVFIALIGLLIWSSCSKNEVVVNVERIPCEFHASQFVANVDDVTPLTKTDKYREIYYRFENGKETIDGTCVENMRFKVDLQRSTTYRVKFITNSLITSWHEYPDVRIHPTNPRVFNVVDTLEVKTEPITKEFTLKHLSGKFTAKVGKIPTNHEVVLEVIEFKNWYNWLTDVSLTPQPGDEKEDKFYSSSKEGDILYSRFVVGDTDVQIKVGIRKIGSNSISKNTAYTYLIPKAYSKVIIFNINNMTGSDDLNVTVYEEIIENSENQQIGKPKK